MSAQLDPDLLRTFVAIVDAGGFTQAARQVHRTQSAVSMQVRRLEETLDRPLFQRDGRGVQLSPDGEALLGYARRLLKLHDEAVAALTRPDSVSYTHLDVYKRQRARSCPRRVGKDSAAAARNPRTPDRATGG